MLLLLATVLTAVDADVKACFDDDADACHRLGEAAMLSEEDGSRAEAFRHFEKGCTLGNGDSCLAAGRLSPDADVALMLKDRGDRLNAETRIEPAPVPAPRVMPASYGNGVRQESPDLRRVSEERGKQWGLLGLVLGKAGNRGVSAMAGIGVRVGFRERTEDEHMFMPAGALLAGGEVDPSGDVNGWVETRVELMNARGGGLLQPSIHGYVSTGLRIARVYRSPLTGIGGPIGVQPYFGFGGGWNWVPREGPNINVGSLFAGSSWQGAAAVAVAMIIALPLILAGRIELRVSPGVDPDMGTEFAAVTGFGF